MSEREIVERLWNTLQAMAATCSVDMSLWDRHSNGVMEAASVIERLAAERDESRALLDEAARALEPFVNAENNMDSTCPDDLVPELYDGPTCGEIRTARAVHAKIKGDAS